MAADTLPEQLAEERRPSLLPSPTHAGAAVLFWLLTALYLVPIWAFHYVPTQDGPAHLSGALALKEFGAPGTRYHEFFEVRAELFPNWLSHLFLVGLMYLVPPLIAEKILVTLYILGFAGAGRYFLTALGGAGRLLAPAVLLFVYSRCFWLGFYNFCLSLTLVWLILGLVLRRRDRLGLAEFLLLTPLFLLTYFCHLFGFLLAAGSAGWLALTARSRPLVRTAWVAAAGLPAAGLTLLFLLGTGFFHTQATSSLGEAPLAWILEQGWLERLQLELLAMQYQVFEPHGAGRVGMGLAVWGLLACLGWTAFANRNRREGNDVGPRAWPLASLGLFFFLAYFVAPDHFGAGENPTSHGGFVKARLALLPPLFWLACLPEPRLPGVRRLLTLGVLVMVGSNFALVVGYFRHGNREIEEYTAGIARAGHNCSVYALEPVDSLRPISDPLQHAAGYYCLETGNINLENYQPKTTHFPLFFREGIPWGYGDFATYSNPGVVDIILDWNSAFAAGVPASFQEAFHEGRMRIFVKR
jgi:hypothetical protein